MGQRGGVVLGKPRPLILVGHPLAAHVAVELDTQAFAHVDGSH